jgi:asparagine synthase (glutamine-hydrolysing)
LCGIIGICAKKNLGIQELPKLSNATSILKKSSPVNSSFQLYDKCGFGHTLLSISDPDVQSNQPFISQDTRYTLVFNVEIYNYRELKVEWENTGIQFKTISHAEVLFELLKLIGKRPNCPLVIISAANYNETNSRLVIAAATSLLYAVG